MPGRLPDPARSRVVIIGCSRYSELPELPTVHNNVGGLAAIMRDPGIWGIPAEFCTVVHNPGSPKALIHPIAEAAEEATDTLVVYYAGHGLVNHRGDLHLSVMDSEAAHEYTQVPFEWVRGPILNSAAPRRILILDCCYSGRAADGVAMGAFDAYAEQAAVDGSFVLTATPANRLAQAPLDQQYTAFTQELIETLAVGLGGGDELISLSEIYANIRVRLRSRDLPVPQARDQNNVGAGTVFRNKAFRAGGAVRDISAEERDAESLAALQRIRGNCQRASLGFLRREQLPVHDAVYVRRELDDAVETAIRALGPANLRRTQRYDRSRPEYVVDRAAPPRLIVVGAPPGTGKTMLAVQLMRSAGAAVLRRPVHSLAGDLHALLTALGPRFGISQLITARVPFVYVVDGVDRSDRDLYQREVIDLIRFIENTLDPMARNLGLLAYPIAVLITLRSGHWDQWFTVLEGRDFVELRYAELCFTPPEARLALERYCAAYGYRLTGDLPAGAVEDLVLPINIRLLSEAWECGGELVARDVLEVPLHEAYLIGMRELARQCLFLTGMRELPELLEELAIVMVSRPNVSAPQWEVLRIMEQSPGLTEDGARAMLQLLITERVLEATAHDVGFAHPALAEYLIASAAVRLMTESGRADPLERLNRAVAESSGVSTAAVRANVEELTAHTTSQRLVDEYYRTSAVYAGSRMTELRNEIALGGVTARSDLESIYGSLESLTAEDAWSAFFIVVAKRNQQPPDRIQQVFFAAWAHNEGRPDRWKLLSKLHQRELLYQPEVLTLILRSDEPREWETFFGWVNHESDRLAIFERVSAAAELPLTELIGDGPEWEQTRGLINLLAEGAAYVEGQVFDS